MTLRAIAATLSISLAWAPVAGAGPRAITREAQRDVAVTIYNGNLGLVRDVRAVTLPVGVADVPFMDVATQIDPTSGHLRSLDDPAGLKILEQNYEYDLLSSQKLLEKYVGRKVRLFAGDGTFHEATLLSTNGPVFEINGQIHLGHSGRLVLPAIPENLVSTPTLVWLLRNQRREPQRIEASYLTGGITWKADYVLVLDPTDARADLTGWVTLDNKSGATYGNAALKLVAGDVHRVSDRRVGRAMELAAKAASAADARREFVEEGLFEYHLYSLDGRTTVKDNQTKQLSLLAAAGVPVDKRLIYYGAQEYYRNAYGVPVSNQKVGVYLDIRNGKAERLGLPLPAGTVRVYKADSSGSQQFVGEDRIDHTPEDERVRINLGNAFDVVGERVQKEWRKLADTVYEVEWQITLRNHKAQAQAVTVIEPVPGDWQVLTSTHPWEKIDSHTLSYEVQTPAKGAVTIRYRLRIRY
jgi:hypothetical protein